MLLKKRILVQSRRPALAKWYFDHFKNLISTSFELCLDSKNPFYIFHEAHLIDVLNYQGIRIALAGENCRIDFNISDYGIGFDHLIFLDRYLRFPLYLFYKDSLRLAENRHIKFSSYLGNKFFDRKFCNFLVSNGRGSEFRTIFFHKLSSYRKVDSGGKYLNNIGYLVDDKFKWQKEYKFSICFENSSTSGYLTEKLIEAFAADTIPIYWGDPDAFGSIFASKGGINPKAVIYINPEDVDEGINEILRVDSDPELYFSYLKEPLFLDAGHSEIFYSRLSSFLVNIFEQPIEKAYRRGFGMTRLRIENRNIARSNKFLSFFRFLKKRFKF